MTKVRSKTPSPKMGQLRIIGGQWRSRKLNFIEAEGLRPTSDRVRETLFNWLNAYVAGAKVLDPFAGSGALCLEALSRGAAEAVGLELNPQTLASLRQHLVTLQCTNASFIQADALQYLAQPASKAFDLVFLDPPFRTQMLTPVCTLLENQGWLAPQAWIYTESEEQPSSLALPSHWRLHREKQAGQVHYSLWQRET